MTSTLYGRRDFLFLTGTGVIGLLMSCDDKESEDSGPSNEVDTDADTDTDPPASDTDADTDSDADVDADTDADADTDTDTDADADADADTDTDTDTDTDPSVCEETPDNIEGPYWLEGVPVRTEYDLYDEIGTSLTISGKVTDLECRPIADAIVEIWHANPAGAYDNTSEEKRYRGQMSTDAEGNYSFHTLKPGWYLNGSTYRPSHIHIKIWVGGEERKTTQLYWEGDPYLEGDSFVVDGLILPLFVDADGAMTGTFDFAVNTDTPD